MQVGKILPYDLQKNFSKFYSELNGTVGSGYIAYCPRIIHNQEQIIRCQLRDGSTAPNGYIKYWNMDGTEAAQFTIGSGGVAYTNILDMYWLNTESKFVYMTMDPTLVSSGTYNIYKCDPSGSNPELVVGGMDVGDAYGSWNQAAYNGYTGITADDEYYFVKVKNMLYKINRTLSGTWVDLNSQVSSGTNSFHYGDGSGCKNLMFQQTPNDPTCSGYVLYTWCDTNIGYIYLRSINKDDLSYLPTRWTILGITDYASVKEPICLNQLDYDSLHYLAITTYSGATATLEGVTGTWAKANVTPAYLNVFNIDHQLAAFLNVNSTDTVMPAGIGATADLIATVCNCWGTTLSGKLVQFWVSSGDGGVYPTWDYTDESGRATTTFTTGANVGISNISVVVNEI